MKDLVSVVIPSFNHEAFLPQAVESVLRQTHVDLELLIVDDGSTDRSRNYLHQLKDIRVRIFENNNMGAHAAINFGLERAQGNWLAILNSDDVFHPRRLAVLLDRLKRSGCALATSWIEIVDGAGKVVGTKRGWESDLPIWAVADPAARGFNEHLRISNFISTTSNMLFSREVFERVGGMRSLRFAHDWDFALRAADQFDCIMVEEFLLQYRVHATNTIRTNNEAMMFEVLWVQACYGRGAGAYGHALHQTAIDHISRAIAAVKKSGFESPEEVAFEDQMLREEVALIVSAKGSGQ